MWAWFMISVQFLKFLCFTDTPILYWRHRACRILRVIRELGWIRWISQIELSIAKKLCENFQNLINRPNLFLKFLPLKIILKTSSQQRQITFEDTTNKLCWPGVIKNMFSCTLTRTLTQLCWEKETKMTN